MASDGDRELPSQINAFEKWLIEKAEVFPPSSYMADIRFDIRKEGICRWGSYSA